MLDLALNGTITIVRGDTFDLTILLNCGTILDPTRYTLNDLDKVYFALEEPNQEFEHAVLKKELTKKDINGDGNIIVKFESSDTIDLIPGTYYYEIKLHLISGDMVDINTVVPKTQFIIL